MNQVFVDTSAILALLVATDEAHPAAKMAFARLAAREAALLTTSYVLVETYALLGRRLGIEQRSARIHQFSMRIWKSRKIAGQSTRMRLPCYYQCNNQVPHHARSQAHGHW
ncbi:MAG: PIN domain-containing protein [Candidatus Contendobacter sp.]|nr:PIN domain-containing protein [Candidatus Contendobacter sp.]